MRGKRCEIDTTTVDGSRMTHRSTHRDASFSACDLEPLPAVLCCHLYPIAPVLAVRGRDARVAPQARARALVLTEDGIGVHIGQVGVHLLEISFGKQLLVPECAHHERGSA